MVRATRDLRRVRRRSRRRRTIRAARWRSDPARRSRRPVTASPCPAWSGPRGENPPSFWPNTSTSPRPEWAATLTAVPGGSSTTRLPMPTLAVTWVVPGPKVTSTEVHLACCRSPTGSAAPPGTRWWVATGCLPCRRATARRSALRPRRPWRRRRRPTATTATNVVTNIQRSGDPPRRPLATNKTRRGPGAQTEKNPNPPSPPSQCGHHGPLENRFDKGDDADHGAEHDGDEAAPPRPALHEVLHHGAARVRRPG